MYLLNIQRISHSEDYSNIEENQMHNCRTHFYCKVLISFGFSTYNAHNAIANSGIDALSCKQVSDKKRSYVTCDIQRVSSTTSLTCSEDCRSRSGFAGSTAGRWSAITRARPGLYLWRRAPRIWWIAAKHTFKRGFRTPPKVVFYVNRQISTIILSIILF